MDIICHYFRNGYVIFYNCGEEEIKDLFERFVYARPHTVPERVRESIWNLDEHISHSLSEFSPKDILRF